MIFSHFYEPSLMTWCIILFVKMDLIYSRQRDFVNKNHISYGGILKNLDKDVPVNDTDVQNAVKFAMEYGLKRFPSTFSTDIKGIILPYSVFKIFKLKLVYSSNDRDPLLVQTLDASSEDPAVVPLVWGFTYSFHISWPQQRHTGAYTHHFVVTEYWDRELYVFQHTFHRDVAERASGDELGGRGVSPDIAASQQPVLLADTGATAANIGVDLVSRDHSEASGQVDNEVVTQGPELNSASWQSCDREASSCDPVGSASPHKYSEPPHTPQGLRVRVLSYNVWNMNSVGEDADGSRYVARIHQLTKEVLESGADVVGFQEVRFCDGSGGKLGPNQVSHLADALGEYQFVLRPAQVQSHAVPARCEEGPAIFSRLPVTATRHLLLTRDRSDVSDGHQRMLLHAEILLPNGDKLNVLNTHLSLSHVARQRTVREMWKYTQKLAGGFVILMGDFNAEAHNDEVRFLAGETSLDGTHTHGLSDVWKEKHPDDRGYTWNTLEDALEKRIDLMFMRRHERLQLEDVMLLDSGRRRSQASSDHLGLMADFIVKKL